MSKTGESHTDKKKPGGIFPLSGKGMFLTHVIQLVSGTTLSQVLAILVSPILSRLFLPEVFGTASVFSAITLFLGVCACLRFEMSISLPEKEGDAANLLFLSILNSLGTSTVVFLLLSLWGDELLVFLKAQPLKPFIWLIPIQIFLVGSSLALTYWHIRCRRFSRMAGAMIVQTLSSNGLQMGIGFAGWPTVGTRIGSNVGGSAVSLSLLAAGVWRNDRLLFFRSVRLLAMKHGLLRYRKFLYISTWAAVLSGFSMQLPFFCLSRFFNLEITGFFTLANRLLLMPVSVIGDAVAQVFYQQAVQYNREGKVDDLIRKVFHGLLEISFLPFFLLSVFGRDLFIFVFDKQWAEAGIYAQILAPSAMIMFVSAPIGTLFLILEKQEVGLKMQIFIFLSRLGSLWIGGRLDNARTAILLYSLSGVIVFLTWSRYVFKYAGMKSGSILSIFFRVIHRALPFVAVIVAVAFLSFPPWAVTVFSGFVMLAYFYLLYLRESEMLKMLLKSFRKKRGYHGDEDRKV